MQNRKDSLILKQKGNYIPLLKHGESVQVNEERGYCCPRTAKTGNLYRKKEPTIVLNNNSGFFFRKRFSFTLLFDIFFYIQTGKARFVS